MSVAEKTFLVFVPEARDWWAAESWKCSSSSPRSPLSRASDRGLRKCNSWWAAFRAGIRTQTATRCRTTRSRCWQRCARIRLETRTDFSSKRWKEIVQLLQHRKMTSSGSSWCSLAWRGTSRGSLGEGRERSERHRAAGRLWSTRALSTPVTSQAWQHLTILLQGEIGLCN